MDEGNAGVEGIVAESAEMKGVLDACRRVAKVDATVLVTGESGAGKERIAQLLHSGSPRRDGPFVAVNCGAIPETLLESELFGHARGSFTGAVGDREGLFEAARGGTLFLDEVGEIALRLQPKLLRALQEREVRRIGETLNRQVDVRLVAATNRNLTRDVAAGRFREDLLYRLKVVELWIPPLRRRPDDVLPLAHRFLAEAASQFHRPVTALSKEVEARFMDYSWPGNARELKNAVERAVVMAKEPVVRMEDLPEEVREGPGAQVEAIRPLAEVEREHVLAALRACNGNQMRAARALKIGMATLSRKLQRYRDEKKEE